MGKGKYQVVREFDGKRYRAVAIYWADMGVTKLQAKKKADKKAATLRKQGWLVRVVKQVIKGTTAYRVYRRRK